MRRANVLVVILLAALALALLACGKDESTGTATSATARTATTARVPERSTADGCLAVSAAKPAANPNRRRPRKQLNPHRVYTVTMRTNCGTIRIRLAVARAPKTTASFAGLVRTKFFDGLSFHRIAKPGGNDFVIQGGDPLGTGDGGPGYTVVEPPPKGTTYKRYDVAMAKTQTEPPGTSGSQFFIVTAADAGLPPEYAVLGEVVGDKHAVTRIAAVPSDPVYEKPLDPVVMSSVRLESRKR
jgi:peptidyl-prolyl cis-trans isomerase B (cyclophilin B)